LTISTVVDSHSLPLPLFFPPSFVLLLFVDKLKELANLMTKRGVDDAERAEMSVEEEGGDGAAGAAGGENVADIRARAIQQAASSIVRLAMEDMETHLSKLRRSETELNTLLDTPSAQLADEVKQTLDYVAALLSQPSPSSSERPKVERGSHGGERNVLYCSGL
jgi:hypothetical protein